MNPTSALVLRSRTATLAAIVTFPRVCLVILGFLVFPFAHAAVGIGDSRASVLEQFGEPAARARRGDREIFLYPHGGRIEFTDGRVVEVDGELPKPVAAVAAPATAAAPTASVPPAAAPRAESPGPPPSSEASLEKLTEQMENAPNPAQSAEALTKQLTTMNPGSALASLTPSGRTHAKSAASRAAKLIIGLALHFGVTMLALRIAFKIEEMDALRSGTFAIAAIDLAVYGLLQMLGPLTDGLSSMTAIQSGICALVMVFTIRKFCINQRLQNAVLTAMAVKFVVQLCDMFLFALVLQTLFG
ncbi:MAG TPA: hypothetical protein VHE61_12870 [Opitutaceae bacterium]|nr:hypothetical protein [Opitutaceae bacterium]